MSSLPTLTSLLGESRYELIARLDAANTFAEWVRRVPQLGADGSITSVADVFSALAPGAPVDRWDGVLWSLLRLAAVDGEDDNNATLTVLHAVKTPATRLLRRDVDAGLVLGELTIQIRTYPWRTRTRAVAGNLLRDTERALWQETAPAWMRTRQHAVRATETYVSDFSEWVDEDTDTIDDLDLVDLLVWAERTGIVNARHLSMLAEYYYGRDATGAGHERVAELFGVTQRTSKRHCATALTALQAAAPAYLAS